MMTHSVLTKIHPNSGGDGSAASSFAYHLQGPKRSSRTTRIRAEAWVLHAEITPVLQNNSKLDPVDGDAQPTFEKYKIVARGCAWFKV
jgi:hypothetical protein